MPRHLPRRAPRRLASSTVELAFEVDPPRRTRSVEVRREDKDVFDALQAWWLLRYGERVTQWELFTVLLADALDAPAGRLSGFSPRP